MLWFILFGVAAAVLFWRIRWATHRALAAHLEAQVRMLGSVAIEVGEAFAPQRGPQWRKNFQEATIAFAVADADWWRQFRRSSSVRRVAMAQRRIDLQRELESYIDPVECLEALVEAIHFSMNPQ